MIGIATVFAQAGAVPGTGIRPSNELSNPVGFIESAAEAMPIFDGGVSGPISIVLLLTVLALAPAILILCTSFTRFLVVLGLLLGDVVHVDSLFSVLGSSLTGKQRLRDGLLAFEMWWWWSAVVRLS